MKQQCLDFFCFFCFFVLLFSLFLSVSSFFVFCVYISLIHSILLNEPYRSKVERKRDEEVGREKCSF